MPFPGAQGPCAVAFHREGLLWPPDRDPADKTRAAPAGPQAAPLPGVQAGRRDSGRQGAPSERGQEGGGTAGAGQTGMAAGSAGQRLREEARCPVCLDFLQDPVSVDCGHSFCRRCISEFCDRADGEPGGLFACPQCRGPFRREGFRPNRQLASLVDGLRQLGPGSSPAGPQCARHGQELSLFCEEDQAALCWACDSGPEHRGHRTAPLQEAARRHQVSGARGAPAGRPGRREGPSDPGRPSGSVRGPALGQGLAPAPAPKDFVSAQRRLPALLASPACPWHSAPRPHRRCRTTPLSPASARPWHPPCEMSPLPQHALRLGRGSLPLLRGTPSATLAKEHRRTPLCRVPLPHSPPPPPTPPRPVLSSFPLLRVRAPQLEPWCPLAAWLQVCIFMENLPKTIGITPSFTWCLPRLINTVTSAVLGFGY